MYLCDVRETQHLNLYTMELKEINNIPRTAEESKHIRIAINGKECYISVWQSPSKYYIELSGWYTGKTFWSTSRKQTLKEIFTEVSKIAMEISFNAFERDNEL